MAALRTPLPCPFETRSLRVIVKSNFRNEFFEADGLSSVCCSLMRPFPFDPKRTSLAPSQRMVHCVIAIAASSARLHENDR